MQVVSRAASRSTVEEMKIKFIKTTGSGSVVYLLCSTRTQCKTKNKTKKKKKKK